MTFQEDDLEQVCLGYLSDLGYEIKHGPDIGPGGEAQERDSWSEIILGERLVESIQKINPGVDYLVANEAKSVFLRNESQSLASENLRRYELLVNGVTVETRVKSGETRHQLIRLIDFENLANNDWLAVNQFTVIEAGRNRRPDIVIFINGIPIAVFELKKTGEETATLRGAFNQIQTYRNDVPSIFLSNVFCILSDGLGAVISSYSAGFEHFAPWKTIASALPVVGLPQIEVLTKGVFDKTRVLDLIENFVLFSNEPGGLVKRVAKYHQFWAVNALIESTRKASDVGGDGRGGVVWHTQGSGKSIEMLFFVAKLMRDPSMHNPTVVLLTDRNDLDDQLFMEVFQPSKVLPEEPSQATTRTELRKLLTRQSGGIIFTTLQKFAPEIKGDAHPVLTDRRNVVVIADEAHRSQYGFLEGFAKHLRDALPGATYVGFTGTPIEVADKSTTAVFGGYVDTYDLTRAVDDGATVRIFYESRLARVFLSEKDRELIDTEVLELTESEEVNAVEAAKSRWSRIEAIVGASERLDLVARDIVNHWESRKSEIAGKAMIVCMSRRICVELFKRIIEIKPEWDHLDPERGKVKVIMTGSASDPAEYQRHLYSKDTLRKIKSRAKDVNDELDLVIIRDMWLTGFDSPSLNTLYVDKMMQGVGLMQAIARVNRTFKDKPGGLIVDYIGIADNLRSALADYSQSDRDQAGVPIEEVVAATLEKFNVIKDLLHGHTWNPDPNLPLDQKLVQMHLLMNFILEVEERKNRFMDQCLLMLKGFALAGSHPSLVAIRPNVKLLADVRAAIAKLESEGNPGDGGKGGSAEIDTAISQLVSQAISADRVVDIFAEAGFADPDISILSNDFLDDLTKSETPNLQVSLLKKLLNDEIRKMRKTNLVKSRKFSDLLDKTIARYNNRNLTTAEIIAELVELAKSLRDVAQATSNSGLSVAEVAFYDAVTQNGAALTTMGDETLKKIAKELVDAVKESATIDWTLKQSVKAAMRAKIKRLLAKYDYPPDLEEEAIELVLEQAELLADSITSL